MKKQIYLLVFSLLISIASIHAQDWVQIGQDIDGEAASDWAGWSVSINSDGSIVAIGSPYGDGNSIHSGQVRVFQNNSGTWTQVGNINGEATFDQFGTSVSLSSDGSLVAIGSIGSDDNGTDSGKVLVYRNTSGVWTQIGNDINGERPDNFLGTSVSLNSDGSIVAIGASEYFVRRGQVRVYQNISGTWTELGTGFVGDDTYNYLGTSVTLNSDGSIVAFGAPGNNGLTGQVKVFQNNSGVWTQIGSDILGDSTQGYFGSSVSLNSDGSIIAIGAMSHISNSVHPNGYVRVYQNVSGTWLQIGADIEGEAANDLFGRSVNLSADGSVVVIGADQNCNNGIRSGQARVFRNISGNWIQIGTDINGEAAEDYFGFSTGISADGSVVAIGGHWNDGNGDNSGHVRVYENISLSISELQEAGISIYPNPSTGVFSIKNAEDYEITITDITGKIVYHTTATTNEQVHLQQRGVYIIHFRSETKRFSYKMIVE